MQENNIDKLEQLATQMCSVPMDQQKLPDLDVADEMRTLINTSKAKADRCKKADSKLRHYESLVMGLITLLDGIKEIT